MKRTDEVAFKRGQPFFDRISDESKKTLVKSVVALLVSVIYSSIRFEGRLLPFGVSVFASFSSLPSFFALVGASISYISASSALGGIRYVAQMMIIAAVKWAFAPFFKTEQKWAIPALSGAVNLAVNSVMLISQGTVIYDILLTLCEATLCTGAVYFLSETVSFLEKGQSLKDSHNVVAFSLSCALLFMSISKVNIGALSVSFVLASFFVLCMALSLGSLGGSLAALSVGAALSLSLSDGGFSVLALGLSGMLSGLFSKTSRYAVAILFLVCALFSVSVISQEEGNFSFLYSSICACVIFLMIPEKYIKLIGYYFPPISSGGREYPNKYLAARLDFVSKALVETAKSICDTTDAAMSKSLYDMDRVFAYATDRVCRRCSNKLDCWDSFYSDTMDCFNHIIPVLKRHGKMDIKDAPESLKKRCTKLPLLTNEVNTAFLKAAREEQNLSKIKGIKEVVCEQFSGMSRLLCEMSQELSLTACDSDAELKIESALLRSGVCASEISCPVDRFGRKSVEFYCLPDDAKKLEIPLIEDSLSDILCTRIVKSSMTENDFATRLCFSQEAPFSVETAYFQKGALGERVCGDSFTFLSLNNGYFAAILSDGMGRGEGAEFSSKMTVDLISKFLSLGFPLENCANLVGSALNLKSEEETLSTLDAAIFDLYAGKVSIKKAGAAQSYIKRGKRVQKIQAQSLPLGIISKTEVKGAEVRLSAGDIVILCSDGICALKDSQVESVLKKSDNLSLKEIATALGQGAAESESQGCGDDITVLVMRMV